MSSNETATRWFISDDEFLAANQDYAVVFEISANVSTAFRMHDNGLLRWPPEYFGDIVDGRDLTDCYLLAGEGRLVYADVDEATDPEHLRPIENARQEQSKEEAPGTAEIREGLVAYLLEESKMYEDDEDHEYIEPLYPNRNHIIKGFKGDAGIVACVEYCLIQDFETRKILLNVLTEQTRCKSPRPVLLLLGMIDSFQSTQWGRTEGFASAYDFEKNKIIVKPFVSQEGHHPLGESWGVVSSGADDGPCFRCSPVQFVGRFLQLSESLERNATDSQNLGFKLMTYYHISVFVNTWWDVLAMIPNLAAAGETFTEAKLEEFKAAQTRIVEAMKKIKFLEQRRPKNIEQRSVNFFQKIRDMLEEHEIDIRSDALEAKDEGMEKLGTNVAGFYEKLSGLLNGFIKNPANEE
ncbi:MAG: hypothetical protein LQ351_006634 [Letrouitia transgressa]|nr:MAG: hypothetical protein LQ351_006634 [Letrouitia transgressa]